MAILNWIVCKAIGRPTAGENCDNIVQRMLNNANISEHNLKMYRAEKSRTNSYFSCRYYVGDAKISGKVKGLIIEIDENTGYAISIVCEKQLSNNRDYLFAKFQKDCKRDIDPVIPRFLRMYYGDEITGKQSINEKFIFNG
jgi:hypothetical protein